MCRLMCTLLFGLILPAVQARAELSESQLRDKLMASTVIVGAEMPSGEMYIGTGWVLSTKDKKIMTAYHVTQNASKVIVIFHRMGPNGWITNEQEMKQFPRHSANIVLTDKLVDLAVITVPTMPSDTPELKFANTLPKAKSKVYLVGHRAKPEELFRFREGVVQGMCFNAITTPNHGDQLTNRADAISFTAENVGKGTSGAPLVDSNGEVVGVVACVSIEIPTNCKAVSLREIRKMFGYGSTEKEGPAQSIVGRWVVKSTSSNMEFGVEFTSEKKFAMDLLHSQVEGTYRLSRHSLTFSYDQKNDRNEFEWIDDNRMRLTKDGQVFDCQRYDFGWPSKRKAAN